MPTRYKLCGFDYKDNGAKFATKVDNAVSSHIPELNSGGLGAIYFLTFLASRHIARTTVDDETSKNLLRHIDNANYIFHPTKTASTTDNAALRFSCSIHTYINSPNGHLPYSKGDIHPHHCFLSGLIGMALGLGVPWCLIPALKLYAIGYEERPESDRPNLGNHNDDGNLTDDELLRLRIALCIQKKKRVIWELMHYQEGWANPRKYKYQGVNDDENDEDTAEAVIETEGEVACEMEDVDAYCMTAMGSGTYALCVDGDMGADGNKTFIVPHHRVENVSGGKALSFILDLYLPSLESLREAVSRFRKNPLKINFKSDEHVKKLLSLQNELRVS